ncbi:MAG: glycosyl hydrolase family 43 [Pseudopedobacter saltans]|uniref:Glycosyl hydrolase family 43 n=1 Tax=Pseudopedobacter saltans TaxID=151895 RepID=A0A2W5GAD2_9SPHI|nr:MAG: glycosyl hydrolase family 43 [Pseudopedobacter saltans]
MRQYNCFLLVVLCSLLYSCGKDEPEMNTQKSDSTALAYLQADFKNPICVRSGDPWIVQKDGYYYYTYTQGSKLVLYKTKFITQLDKIVLINSTIWTPPAGEMYSQNVWAPELHELNGKWYMYFAADNGQNKNHRMYVIENTNADPTTHDWTLKGKVSDVTNNWAIDGTILDYNGQLYMVWSGWESETNNSKQNIYIAKLKDPWTIDGDRVKLSSPDYSWELHGQPVNEGPAVLKSPDNKYFITYSASFYGSDDYALGMLSVKPNGDPMNPKDWTKSDQPVFKRNDQGGVYGPGHNGFFKSPDGKEDWIVYHARSLVGGSSNNDRNTRIQKFAWNADGTPNFGTPVSISQYLKPPSF